MNGDPTAIDVRLDPLTQRMTGVTYHGQMEFDVPYMTEVVPGLWQGGCRNGLVLPEHIDAVFSLYPWERYVVRHDCYQQSLKMYDSHGPINRTQVLSMAKQVNEWRQRDKTVLVHCQAGLNRSALIVATALMIGPEQMSAEQAITLLRDKRSGAVLCNTSFVDFLRSIDGIKE